MPQKISNKKNKEICRMYKDGISCQKISVALGLNKKTINKYVHQSNLMRNLSEACKKYKVNSNFFSTYTPKSCYWAGFIAGDGCIIKNHYKEALTISTTNDRNHLKMFIKDLDSNYSINSYKNNIYKHKIIYTIKIHDQKLINDLLNNFNITPRKSLTIRYPIQMPQKFNRYFIRGLFDADGNIRKDGNRFHFRIISGSLNLLQTVQNILIKNCNLNQTKIYIDKNSNAKQLEYNSKKVCFIMNFLSMPFALSRKNLRCL